MTPGALVSWFGLVVAVVGLVWTARGESARPRNDARIYTGVVIGLTGLALIFIGALL